MFHEAVYRAGIVWRNSLINDALKSLTASQYWDRGRVQNLQEDRLANLLQWAYSRCRFYRDRFDEAGFDPKSFGGLADLRRIPTVAKEDFLARTDDIQTRVEGQKHFYSETSGSSGKPLVFYRNAMWDAWHRASAFRGYQWHGVNPWERNGYLWGYNLSPSKRRRTRVLDALQNRFRLFSYDEGEIGRFIRKLEGAEFLSGYSSMIYEVAKRVNRLDSPPRLSLKMVMGTSEKIYERYQPEVERAFGRRMISEYGAAEAGIMAFECAHGTMHVNGETCILEELDHEVVVTNLFSHSFPIIRYRLGDYIQLDMEGVCGCGRYHPAVKEVLGRVGRVIHGRAKQYPSLTLYYVFKNLAMEHDVVLNYQARQHERGVLEVHIEGQLPDGTRQLLNGELAKYYGDDMEWRVVEGADFKSDYAKRKDFVTTLVEN